MSSEKKLTLLRLAIFLVIAFLPFCIIVPVMWSYFGEPIYASTNEAAAVPVYILGVFGMMTPSLANLLTRLITKEGFGRSYLGFKTKGKIGYYAASVIVPIAYSAIACVLIWAFFLNGISFSDTFTGSGLQTAGIFMLQLISSVMIFFPAFGEEWGWRGYMMPKLFELMPKPAAIVVGGIIWGLWHAPLTIAGHNFGVDYPGYPFAGIGLMCLMCIFMNGFLTLLTEKTGSVYPAAFVHSLNNNMSAGVMFMLFGSEAANERVGRLSSTKAFIPYLAVLAVIFIISMVILMKKRADN